MIRVLATCTLLVACAGGARPTLDEGAIVRGDRSERELALVFTGGEFGEGTAHVLDVLRAARIEAAFFVTGDYVVAHAPRVRRMVAEGHYVGPHSDSHPLYCAWEDRSRTLVSEGFFKADLNANIADLRALGALTPGEPIWFIPPYEWFNREQVEWAAEMGVELFNFTPGSGSNRDWIPEGHDGFVSSRQIRDDILDYEQREGLEGFLLLLHLGSAREDKMHAELEPLLDELARRGYRFVRADALLNHTTRARTSRRTV